MNWDMNISPGFHPQALNNRLQIKSSRSIDFVPQLSSTMISNNNSEAMDFRYKLRNKQAWKEKQLSLSNNIQKCLRQGLGKKKNGLMTSRGSCEQLLSRANSQVYKLSQSNRLKSQNKIKNEQMCFRIKLKMITLMRKLNIKNEEVEKFQNLEPEQFIINFYNKMTSHYRENQQETKKLRQKSEAVLQTLKQKNQQLNKQTQKYKQVKQQNGKYVKLLKQQNKTINIKDKQIDNLLFQIQSLNKKVQSFQENQKRKNLQQQQLIFKISTITDESYRKEIQISQLEKLLISKKQENQYLAQQNRQINKLVQKLSIFNKKTEKDNFMESEPSNLLFDIASDDKEQQNCIRPQTDAKQFTEMMAIIVGQWKNHLQSTVNSYQKMLQQISTELNKKDQQIKYLKLILQNYLKNKLYS